MTHLQSIMGPCHGRTHSLSGDRGTDRSCLRRPYRSGRPRCVATTRWDERQVRTVRCPAGWVIPDVLTYADASTAPGKATADSDVVEARLVDIVPGVRVVHAVDFVSDDPRYAGTMTMTWEVTATEAGTRVDIRADDVPAGISADDHAAGLASLLANLAAHVER